MGGKNKTIKVFFYHPERKEPKLIEINSNLNSIKSYLNTQNPKELALPRGYHLYFDPDNKDMAQLNRSYGIIGSFLITRKTEQCYWSLEEHDIKYLLAHDKRLINTQRKSEKNMSVVEKLQLLKDAAKGSDLENIDKYLDQITTSYKKNKNAPSVDKLVLYLQKLNALSDKYGTPYVFAQPYFETKVIKKYAKCLLDNSTSSSKSCQSY